MSIPTILFMLVVAAAAGSAAVLVSRLMRYTMTSVADGEDDFSPAHYAPMARLLDPAEAAFLAAQPGVTSRDIARFQCERRGIFRMYLRELAADFASLHKRAREYATLSPEKSPDLVRNLIHVQFRFRAALFSVELQLALAEIGLGHVDAHRLLDAVESLHAALLAATVPPGPVPVS